MTSFEIEPYKGAGPITFDKTPQEVERLLGPASRVQANDLGERDESRKGVSIRYSNDDGKVVEIAFLPSVPVHFRGSSLFDSANILNELVKCDDSPLVIFGFVVFFELGISVTGFHDQNDSQKAITVFRKGRWDEFRNEGVPLIGMK